MATKKQISAKYQKSRKNPIKSAAILKSAEIIEKGGTYESDTLPGNVGPKIP
jgi:hypothetical protein